MDGDNRQEKEKRAGNPIFIFIIFVVLIGFVFFVPDIYKKYNSEISNFLGIKKENPTDTEHDEHKEDTTSPVSAFYQIGSNPIFKYNELNISKVSLENGTLKMTISVDGTFDLSTSGYYVEFFRNRETFIGRRILLDKITKSLSLELDVNNLNLDTTTYFVISHTPDSSIRDNMTPSSDESGITTLTCQKESTSYEYDFYLRKLTNITQKINYTNPDIEEYAKVLLNYQRLEKEYNEYTGVEASIVDNTSSFFFLAKFDYGESSNFKRIGNIHLYEKNIPDYIVKFKMEAEGYDCK